MYKVTIKAARVNAGMTLKEAAQRLDIAPSTLCRWEQGTTKPNADALVKICGLYNAPIECLFFGDNLKV